jgi:hypothetical protein
VAVFAGIRLRPALAHRRGKPGSTLAPSAIAIAAARHEPATNLDTYERIIPEDVKEASAEVAAAVWHVANLGQMVPLFTQETTPAPVPAR